MTKLIDSFRGEYEFLSNFYTTNFIYDGIPYTNSEAAFQASKIYFPDNVEETVRQRMAFSKYSPSVAKKMGRKCILRSDWEQVKDGIMYEILKAKFDSNPYIRDMLIQTGDAVLVEGNTWHDCYWGDCDCPKCAKKVGRNMLGKLLMKLRSEYQREHLQWIGQ